MSRRRDKRKMVVHTAAMAACLAFTVVWLPAERKYELNRNLIAALMHHDTRLTLDLFDRGADPNTHYKQPPLRSVRDFWNRLNHRMPSKDSSPSAFMIAIGASSEPELTGSLDTEADVSVILAMLQHGARANDTCVCSCQANRSALQMAAISGQLAVVEALLANGACVNAQDELGWTALDCTINPEGNMVTRDGDMELIQCLLKHGADPNLKTGEGENALYLAQQKQNREMIALLKQYGAVPIPPEPPDSVPFIAGMLAEKVGACGLIELVKSFGQGGWITGPQPNSNAAWYTEDPPGMIYSDAYNACTEGNNLEFREWKLTAGKDAGAPLVRKLPAKAGWLGDIYPGMRVSEVLRLTSKRLPAPQIVGNTWIWTATGFYRPSTECNVYTEWSAELTFRNEVLVDIYLHINPERLALPLDPAPQLASSAAR